MFVEIFLFTLFVFSPSFADEWHSKSQCTQKEFANHMDIHCQSHQWILIGWSHYGTKKFDRTNSTSPRCEPSENDCIMDYTHKIAELCNGVSKCEVILTQQFIHKCSDEATYLFISYQCVDNSTIVDICSQRTLTSATGFHLISPSFPNEYPNNANCSCSIQPNERFSTMIIDVESFAFNLQDNDRLGSLSGTIPFGASLITVKNQLELTFQTDETLSQSGFWIRLNGFYPCHHDEFNLGSKCIRIFSKKQNWKSAEAQCLALNSNLIHLYDVIQEKKLGYFLSIQQQQQTSFWISPTKDDHSWWPWRSSSESGKCILRTQEGWMKRSCDEEQAFICEREINPSPIPLTVRCGQSSTPIVSKTIVTTTTTTTTIPPLLITEKILPISHEPNLILPSIRSRLDKTTVDPRTTTTIDPNVLAAILAGVAIAIFSMNLVVCYICRRRTQTQSKCKTPNESQSSLSHEELQRSLMQHLYHEQMNTISSTSTSSSSSKQSQAKSNETTTSHVHLLQLTSQPYFSDPTTFFHTSHPMAMINTDSIDYHVYETIPSENPSYTMCTAHGAFKPVLQSNSQTLRPYLPRTNIFHPSSNAVCCYHQHTLKSQVLPSKSTEQNYVGSESIV